MSIELFREKIKVWMKAELKEIKNEIIKMGESIEKGEIYKFLCEVIDYKNDEKAYKVCGLLINGYDKANFMSEDERNNIGERISEIEPAIKGDKDFLVRLAWNSYFKYRMEGMGEFFDKRADSYNEHMEETIDEFDRYYELISKPIRESYDEKSVLDLGCGTGLEVKGIFEKLPNSRIKGIDLSKDMMGEMLKDNGSNAHKIEVIQGSYLEIPFGEESYDYVVSSMTIHHFLYDVKLNLYKKIAAAIKKGGCYIEGDYIVSTEMMESCLQRYHDIMEFLDEEEKGLYHLDIPFDMKTQRELLIKAGFNRIEEVYKNGEHVILAAYI